MAVRGVMSDSSTHLCAPPSAALLDDSALIRQVFATALGTGGLWAELFHESRSDAAVTLAAGGRTLSCTRTGGTGLRIVGPGGAQCLVHTPLDDPRSLLELAGQAREVFAVVAAAHGADSAPPEDSTRPEAMPWDVDPGSPAEIDIDLLAERADQVLATAGGDRDDPPCVRASAWSRRLLTVSSTGVRHGRCEQGTRVVVDAFAAAGGERRKGRVSWAAPLGIAHLGPDAAASVGARAIAQARELLAAQVPASAELPVVLAPPAAALLVHELIGHACEADVVASGRSLIADALHQRVADAVVTVYDGCPDEPVWGADRSDDEGTANRETPLILRGEFVATLTDRRHAADSSGNGRRQSFAHPVLPRVSHTRLASGDTDRAGMLDSVRDGLLVLSVEGGAVNARTGSLNLTVKEARRIRDGELAEPVCGVVLTGPAGSVLSGIRCVGTDPTTVPMLCGKHGQWIPVSATAPSVLVERMRMVGA